MKATHLLVIGLIVLIATVTGENTQNPNNGLAPDPDSNDPYAVLGILRTASQPEIRFE